MSKIEIALVISVIIAVTGIVFVARNTNMSDAEIALVGSTIVAVITSIANIIAAKIRVGKNVRYEPHPRLRPPRRSSPSFLDAMMGALLDMMLGMLLVLLLVMAVLVVVWFWSSGEVFLAAVDFIMSSSFSSPRLIIGDPWFTSIVTPILN